MIPLTTRAGLRCLRPAPTALRPVIPRLTPLSFRFNSSTSNSPNSPKSSPQISILPPTAPPGFTSELVEPVPPPPSSTPPVSIIDRIVPNWASGVKPYLHLIRIDKPIGSLLLFWPGAWGITIASTVHHLPPSVPASLLGLFAVGAVVMRGAGCTINDMWDAKFDRAVERTKSRPIAAGDVSQFQALIFLGAQLSVGLAILTQLNNYTIALGVSSLALVTIYPYMKRITYYPQIVFGSTFMWAIFMGWSAACGTVDWTMAAPLYVGGIAYGVMYDCIYAHQDKVDDVKAGVKSIALAFPDNSRALISTLSAGFVSTLALTGHLAGLGPLYYAISVFGTGAHLAWQCATVDFDSRADCWKKFCSNGYLGGVIWLGMAADYIQNIWIPGLY